jgi:hypothetical protein
MKRSHGPIVLGGMAGYFDWCADLEAVHLQVDFDCFAVAA